MHIETYGYQRQMDPPLKTARAEWSLHCSMLSMWATGRWTPPYYHMKWPIPNLRWSTQIGCYWHLVVNNGNLTLLLTASGQQCEFHIVTDWHLVVKNGNSTHIRHWLLTSSGHQEWQFYICYWHLSRMAIYICYWHLVAISHCNSRMAI